MGATIVETILACFILSAVALAVFEIFPGSMLAMRRASQTIEAGNFAEAGIAKLRSAGYQKLPASGVVSQIEEKTQGSTYNVTVEVFDPPAAAVPSPTASPTPSSVTVPCTIKGLRATVRWNVRGKDCVLVRESWMSSVKT